MDLSIYIHIPFCRTKCLYCDFLSFDTKETEFVRYTNALIQEIQAFDFTGYELKTIFFGGGTPTVLPPFLLGRILETLSAKIAFGTAEITVEANPGTVCFDSLHMLKSSGVNRLSFGLQAWQNRLLQTLGRTHTQTDFLRGYEQAQKVGFDNINVDLMFGLPTQSLSELAESISEVIKCHPKHISLYSLILEEGTPFFKMYEEIDEALDRNMYEKSIQQLQAAGYKRYEISNFSHIGFECAHNRAYWQRKSYVGFGLAAHSFLGNARFSNTAHYETYIARPYDAKENIQHLSLEDAMEEYMFLGLRMSSGISISEFAKHFERSIASVYAVPIQTFISQKLMRQEGDRLFLTESGLSVSNRIFSEFLLR